MENLAPEVNTEDEFEKKPLKRPREILSVVDDDEEEDDVNDQDDDQDDVDDDDEDEGCPICFEQWTTSGFHRICSLKCGHLFGKRCIERWLANGTRTKCPQCNAPAKRTDIRVIYAKRLISAVDTSEKDGLVRQLQEERMAKRMAIEAEAKATIALQVALAELAKTKEELDSLKKRLSHYSTDNQTESLLRFEYFRSFKLSSNPGACRCMDFDPYFATFLVSKAQGNRFGICKVSLLDESVDLVPNLHNDMIRCIAHSPFKDGLALSTGNDSRLVLTAMTSNNVLQSYSLEAPGWSCAFDPFDANRVFAGLANGIIAVFDLRNTMAAASYLKLPLDRKLPIHSLFMPEPDVLIGATMDGPFAVNIKVSAQFMWRSNFDVQGSCTSISVAKNTILASYRMNPMNLPVTHVLAEFNGSEIRVAHSFQAESGQTIMSRSCLAHDDSLVLVPDEPSASLLFYQCNDAAPSKLLIKMETRSAHPILDIRQGQCLQHGQLVGALTGSDLYIYRRIES